MKREIPFYDFDIQRDTPFYDFHQTGNNKAIYRFVIIAKRYIPFFEFCKHFTVAIIILGTGVAVFLLCRLWSVINKQGSRFMKNKTGYPVLLISRFMKITVL